MVEQLLHWISQYGYFAIFVAMLLGILPLPDESTLVFGGYLSSRGELRFEILWLAACLGSIAGATLNYSLGRFLGYGVLHRYGRWVGCDDEKLARLHNWFEKYGGWTLVFGYYVAGVRQLTSVVAGTSRMHFGLFARWSFPAAVLWATIFVTLGRLLGEHWRDAVRIAERNAKGLAFVLGVAIAAYVLYRHWRARPT